MNDKNNETSFKTAFRQGFPQVVVIACGILFFFFIYKIQVIMALLRKIAGILMPVILGLAFAYLINPVMDFFEKHFSALLEKKIRLAKKRKPLARGLAIALSFALVALFLYLLASMVFPLIEENVMNLARALPGEINKLMRWLETKDIHIDQYLADPSGLSAGKGFIFSESLTPDRIIGYILNWVQNDLVNQISVVINSVIAFFSMLLNLLVAAVVAIYVLMSKEIFGRQMKKLVYAFFKEETALGIFELAKQSDRIFGGFISGKIIDSLFIGLICFGGLMLLGIPYAALVSLIVGVTNIIPFFGPYIGAIPSALIIILADPVKGIIFIVFVILLQQFDGNILGPKILGESTGLSPFWIIFSILLGGGLFGLPGMLLGVPTFGVIYYLIRTYVDYRLKKKQIDI